MDKMYEALKEIVDNLSIADVKSWTVFSDSPMLVKAREVIADYESSIQDKPALPAVIGDEEIKQVYRSCGPADFLKSVSLNNFTIERAIAAAQAASDAGKIEAAVIAERKRIGDKLEDLIAALREGKEG